MQAINGSFVLTDDLVDGLGAHTEARIVYVVLSNMDFSDTNIGNIW